MIRWTTLLAGLLVLAAPVAAQSTNARLASGLRSVSGPLAADEKMTLEAQLVWEEGNTKGKIVVTARMIPGWHVYSMDQVGGPGPTKIKIEEATGVKVTGGFNADRPPDVSESTAWPGVMIEEFSDEVSWSAPIEWEQGGPGPLAKIAIRFDGISCDSNAGCIPYMNKKLAAEWKNPNPPAALPTPSADPPGMVAAKEAVIPASFSALKIDQTSINEFHSTLSGSMDHTVIKPGDKLTLQFKFEVDEEFHIYQWHRELVEGLNYSPTLFRLQPLAGFKVVDVQSSLPVSEKDFQGVQVAFYDGAVHFDLVLQADETISAGEYTVRGVIGYQTCDANSCDPPTGAAFEQNLTIVAAGQATDSKTQPLKFAKAKYRLAEKELAEWVSPEPGLVFVVKENTTTSSSVAEPEKVVTGDVDANSMASASAPKYKLKLEEIQAIGVSQDHLSIPVVLGFALLGGFILNFMPCVLPVIGLKVMSFVQQAGSDRFQAFMLNVWYTAGILLVFMVLATMLTFFNFGWGQQSQFASFQIGMAAIVFVMALSFLGVWEIPIPGFVGSSTAAKVAEKEGPFAAIIKGIITTVLAVPCSGPALATALAWCTGKPAYLVYMVFFFMGLGMALPYIILGLNPGLVKLIPRPGMWMEQFKQFMGFVLLATVIWLLWTIPIALMLPAVAFLFGLWFACWWIGTTPITATSGKKAFSWVMAIVIGVGVGWFAFEKFNDVLEGKLDREISQRLQEGFKTEQSADHLAWKPYSFDALAQLAEEERTVMVDFTADWCATCKVLERTVLNTKKVRDHVEEMGIVPLMADWSELGDDIKGMLNQLGSIQIPVLAVFPAGKPNEPIVLIGGYTQSQLLEALQKAGPSKSNVQPVNAETTISQNKTSSFDAVNRIAFE